MLDRSQRLALRTAHISKAVIDCKTLPALGLLLTVCVHHGLLLSRKRSSLLVNGLLLNAKREHTLLRLRMTSNKHTHKGEQACLHVSCVLTVRCSSAKNSADCISFRRETVRGNSCAKGPSV